MDTLISKTLSPSKFHHSDGEPVNHRQSVKLDRSEEGKIHRVKHYTPDKDGNLECSKITNFINPQDNKYY